MAAFLEHKIGFDYFIKFPLAIFKIVLFDFKPMSSRSLKEKILFQVRMSYFLTCIIGFALACSSMILYAVFNSNNFIDAAACVPNAAITMLVGLKSLPTYLRRDEIWDIFQEMQKMFDRRSGKDKNYGIKKYLVSYLRLVRIYAAMFVNFLLFFYFNESIFLENVTVTGDEF